MRRTNFYEHRIEQYFKIPMQHDNLACNYATFYKQHSIRVESTIYRKKKLTKTQPFREQEQTEAKSGVNAVGE